MDMSYSSRNLEATPLIAELPSWNNGLGIDPESWVGCVGSFELAIGYSLVFWPSFARIGEYIVMDGCSEESIKSWEAGGASRKQIENVLNHVHIADLQAGVDTPTEAQVRFLGRTLKSIYETKLRADFPGIVFDVFFNDEPSLDILDYQVTFSQAED